MNTYQQLQETQNRLSICMSCEYIDTTIGICVECECGVWEKTRLMGEECPLQKWLKVPGF